MTIGDTADLFTPALRRERMVDWQATELPARKASVKLGRQTSYAEGFVRGGTGNLAAHASATFSMIGAAPRPKNAAYLRRSCY
jgi:hypothetical protein